MRGLTTEEGERLIFMQLDKDTIECMEEVLPSLRCLHDHLEERLVAAAKQADYAKVVLYSWHLGRVSGITSDIEMAVPLLEIDA